MEASDDLYREILSGSPSQATFFLVLSRMKNEGLLARVIDECTKALEIYPDDLRLRKLRAEACYEDGRVPEAEAEIRTVVAKINELARSYRLLADLCIAQGKTDEAVEALKHYLIHWPDDSETCALLESLAPMEKTPSGIFQPLEEPAVIPAIEPEISARAADEEMPDIATATLAEVYYNQGKIQEAIEVYEKVVERNPGDPSTRARMDELKNILEQARALEKKREATIMRKKKMASILDMWLAGIREQSKAGMV
jgi:tetratricopeptide (TPR) repeat protein